MPSTGRAGSSQTRTTNRGRTTGGGRAAKAPHALTLLKEEHKAVNRQFERYEKTKDKASAADRRRLAGEICDALERHAEMEEVVFYPRLRSALDDHELLDEAEVEHDTAKQAISEIRAMKSTEKLFDAKVKVLGEYVKHHVREEESNLFKEARAADLDFIEIGAEMDAFRKSASSGRTRR